MRKKKIPFARLAAFLVLFAVLLGYMTRVLEDKGGTINGLYDEPAASLDVLYLGGSHANAAFDPMSLYETYGYTGYVLYSWAQPMWTSYYYLEEALKTQNPKVVVLDAFGMAYGNTYLATSDYDSTSDQYSLLIRPGLTRVKLALAMSRCQAEHKSITRYLPHVRYHNRWKSLTASDWLWPFVTEHSTNKGFGPLYLTESFDTPAVPESPAPATIYAPCQEYLDKIGALCAEKGIPLVVTVTPYILASDAEYDLYRQVGDWCAANGAAFLNYLEGEDAARLGFDYGTDLADHGHVNWRGAAKITADLGAFLAEHYDLPDHRNDPAYRQWEADLLVEKQDKQNMDLKLQATLPDLLAKAADDSYVTVIAVRGDLTASDPAPVAGALASWGIPAELTGSTAAGALYVYDGGTRIFASDTGETCTYSQGALTFTAVCTPDAAAVTLADQQICRDCPGVNVVVLDKTTGERVQSIAFLAAEGYASYTG